MNPRTHRKLVHLAFYALIVTAVAACGAGGLFVKPEPPPKVTTAQNAWATAKAVYHANLTLFRAYADAACPHKVCGPEVGETELDVIEAGQEAATDALEVIREGDDVLDGDYSSMISRLNVFVLKLAQRGSS